MAEQSGFFDAHLVDGEYDRVYLAESFAKYFASFISNGIFGGKSNELMVQQKEAADMSVRVLSGQAYINGYWYENDNELSLAIDIADGVLNRIDLIVLRWSNSERTIRLAVKKGTPATNPSAPIIQRSADAYELKLAQVYVKAGSTKIVQANITDTRLDTQVCGFVHGLIEQFDTTEFGKQIDSFIEEFEKVNTEAMSAVLARLNQIADMSDLASLVIDMQNAYHELALATQTLGYSKKNLIPYPFVNTVGTTAEFAGITWTDIGDGTVKCNGTASTNSYFTLYEGEIFLKPGKYMLTAGFNDTTSAYVFIVKVHKKTKEYKDRTTSVQRLAVEITEYDIENYDILISTFMTTGASLSNVIMKPMLRRAEINDETWEPYKLSVAEMIHEDDATKGCFYRLNRFTGNKEWFNPACVPGLEYPLVERWNGQPVYQMTLTTASLPNNGLMVLETNAEWDRVVSISGYAIDRDDLTFYPFPVVLYGQFSPIAIISRVESDGSLVITTNGDASHLEAHITIKYTKSY